MELGEIVRPHQPHEAAAREDRLVVDRFEPEQSQLVNAGIEL